MTKILVYNPSEYDRTEIVKFGCPTDVSLGKELMAFDKYQIRTARILVPAFTSGYIDLNPLPNMGAVGDEGITKSFVIDNVVSKNGDEFRFHAKLASNSDMNVWLFHSHSGISHKHMIVYAGTQEPWAKYELFDSGDLPTPEGEIPIGVKSNNPEEAIVGDYILPQQDEKIHLRDMAGATSVGYIIRPSALIDMGSEAILTALAIQHVELVVAGDYRASWGPNNVPPHGYHIDRNWNPHILAHRGGLCNENPGNTGEQKGFGYWKHLDVISEGRGDLLFRDRYAVIQEGRRFSYLFEKDGRVPVPKDHPLFKSWSETFHWAKFQSPDSFGRRERYTHYGWYDGWGPYDQEHYSAVMLKEGMMLTGSFILRLFAEMRIFHFITQVSYPTAGRALGRNIRGAMDLYYATDDKRVLEKLELVGDKLIETFEAINGSGTASKLVDGPTVLRLINDDPHTKIPGLEWVCWEDAIAVPTIYWLGHLLGKPELLLIAFNLGKTLLNEGFVDNKVLKAIKWNGAQQELGPNLATSHQTNYNEWALPSMIMLTILAQELGQPEVENKAAKLVTTIYTTTNYDNLSSYYII